MVPVKKTGNNHIDSEHKFYVWLEVQEDECSLEVALPSTDKIHIQSLAPGKQGKPVSWQYRITPLSCGGRNSCFSY